MSKGAKHYPTTPDGRYFVVRGRLWRCANPNLKASARHDLTLQLMDARRAIARINRTGDGDLAAARKAVDEAKTALGERGPVWWSDGTPDYNRHLAKNTSYSGWFRELCERHAAGCD